MKVTFKQILIVFLIVLVVVFFAAKKTGVNKSIKNKGVKISGKPETVRDDFDPNTYIEMAHDAIYGIDDSSKKYQMISSLRALSEGELILVYNGYNNKYKKGNKTLLTDLKGEWFIGNNGRMLIAKMELLGMI